MTETAATMLVPLVRAVVPDGAPVQVRFWDGSAVGPNDGIGAVVVRSPDALRRIFWSPGELGLGRAYVAGDIDLEGDILEVLRVLQPREGDLHLDARAIASVVRSARGLGALGRPLPPPPEEVRLRGRRHSRGRDAGAISHHYDVGNDFYRLVLGPTMTYSCARFRTPEDTLEQAQEAKHELVCRKLGLQPGMRLLDVGCGWGGMVLHAARHHGVEAVGVTISRQQYDLASKRIADAGLGDRVEVRLQDYRELSGESYDAISSIGMFEHVGRARLREYFHGLFALLRSGGRLLNHAISTPEGSSLGRRSFMARYVFPDGELQDVAAVVASMEQSGFEVRDVESLREHYALTLRRWVANLEANWDEAVRLTSAGRARVWRLYMSGSVLSFESNEIAVHQVLGVRTGPDGGSGMPLTRESYV